MAELRDIAGDLYGLPPAEFTAARNARAKEIRTDSSLAKQVKTLRRPSVAAWTVNQLVREQPEEITQLLDLGAELRRAQEKLAGEALRELNERRHAVLAAVTKQAGAVATDHGQHLSETVARQVESTLRAAMADQQAAAAVRSGLLTSHVQASGFSAPDLEGAVAVPDVVAPQEADEGAAPRRGAGKKRASNRRLERARREVREAEQEQAAAAERLRALDQRVADIAARRQELAEAIEDLRARMQQARAQDKEAARDARQCGREREEAARAERAADRAAAKARTRLERLT